VGGTDDLAPLLVPAGGDPVRIRQGTITAWDPQTGQNTVHVAGADLTNVQMLSSDQTVVLSAGDVVLLMSTRRQMWIIGRVVTPGAPGFFSGAMNDDVTAFTPTNSDAATQANSLGNWLPTWVGAMVVRHTTSLFTLQTTVSGGAATGDIRIRWYGNHPGTAANPAGGTELYAVSALAAGSYFHDGSYAWPDDHRGTTVFVSVECKLATGTGGVDWVSSIPSRFVNRST